MADSAPRLSLLLIAYNQAGTIADAVAGALAQDYANLEIILSDDASSDETWQLMQQAVSDYRGPHRIVLNRNPNNLGIGAHLDKVARLSSGELLLVAAGDDVSLPQRASLCAAAWVAAGCRPDLIAGSLIAMDADGSRQESISPDQLAAYRNAADWLARPPLVIGAAQAWTRRLFDRHGGLPSGVVYEDLVMVFRAIVGGGAITLDQPLVRYRRGGYSAKQASLSAADVARRLLRGARGALVEIPLLLQAAQLAGQEAAVASTFAAKLRREGFIHDMLTATNQAQRLRLFVTAPGVPLAVRLRLLAYAAFPWVLAPWFAAKRWRARRKGAKVS